VSAAPAAAVFRNERRDMCMRLPCGFCYVASFGFDAGWQ
jgi:hypothetical protein